MAVKAAPAVRIGRLKSKVAICKEIRSKSFAPNCMNLLSGLKRLFIIVTLSSNVLSIFYKENIGNASVHNHQF